MRKGRTLVTSDIHGAHKALLQVLKRCNFDPANDELVVIGDSFDGWPEVDKVVDELLAIPRLTNIRGNHEEWALGSINPLLPEVESVGWDNAVRNNHPHSWLRQGGWGTLNSYRRGNDIVIPRAHREFIQDSPFYHIDRTNRLFVHGGFDPFSPIESQDNSDFIWNRRFWSGIMSNRYSGNIANYRHVFIGHTPTINWNRTTPITVGNVTNVDTGCGWYGKLSIVDASTLECWQSDTVTTLYEGIDPRGNR